MRNRTLNLFTKLLLAAALFIPLAGATAPNQPAAKNIIILIGDGMGPGQFSSAWIYSKHLLNKELNMSALMQAGHSAMLVNDTADAIVTESAAAAGQIATGQLMTVGAISMLPNGTTPAKTILEIAKERNMATGLVTTSGITDATPAAFSAHVAKRADEAAIAEQQLNLNVDILMGGRKQFFLPESAGGMRKDGRNLLDEAKKSGYAVVGTESELMIAPAGKTLGLFHMSNMSYEIDRKLSQEPSLAVMTEKALKSLSANKKGFFLLVEGGRIDNAAHRNDAPATIHDTLAFDAAVGAAMEFAKKNPNTLLLVTADHETGGMSVIGHSKTSKDYLGLDVKAIEMAKTSFQSMAARWGKNPSPEKIRDVVRESLGIELSKDEANTVAADTIKKLDPQNYSYDQLHSLAFVLRPYYRVGWSSQTHTAAPLMLIGSGPGSQKIRGLMHNTDVFSVMKSALPSE